VTMCYKRTSQNAELMRIIDNGAYTTCCSLLFGVLCNLTLELTQSVTLYIYMCMRECVCVCVCNR